MEIIKDTLFSTRKCEYGDFELKPEIGWKITQTFIDYESNLLIVSVFLIDESKWLDNGFNGRTIPTKEYKIDLNTLAILQSEEWKNYFNYDKVEIFSADKKYKLISQRVFDADRNNDGFIEELFDLSTKKIISSSSSIAFRKEKRENLLESFCNSIKEMEEQKRILDEKPTLEQFYTNQLDALKNNDVVICYYDSLNVYQLDYVESQFILSRSGTLPSEYKDWQLMKFNFVKSYSSLNAFWDEFIGDKKWYLKFNYLNAHGLNSSKVFVLAKHIITFFNELRLSHNFTYSEYDKINNWSNLVWSDEYKRTEIKQWCANCFEPVNYQARYPKYICSVCASKNKYDSFGTQLMFCNAGFSGGLNILYKDVQGNTIKEDDTQHYCDCIIENKLFFAQEARFGGIVIQTKE